MAKEDNKKFNSTVWIMFFVGLLIGGGSGWGISAIIHNSKNDESSNSPSVVMYGGNNPATTASDNKKEYAVGETGSNGFWNATISSVERGYTSDNQYHVPKEGKEFIKVNITLENKSSRSLSHNVYNWKIEDSNGGMISPDSESYSIDDRLQVEELASGGKASGALIFELPSGSNGKIHYQPYNGTEIVFKI